MVRNAKFKTLTGFLAETTRMVKESIESFTDAVEDSPVVRKASWEELAARGQRLADKWAESHPKGEFKASLDQIRANIEGQLEAMPKKAKAGTLAALSNLAGVVDNLQQLGEILEPAPEPGATLNAHGMRQVYGPMASRRAAGRSMSADSTIGARRRMHRAWLLDEEDL